MKEIFELDWGTITPEFYNGQKNSVVHIFNHSLLGDDNINRSIKFAIGRIKWYSTYLPKGCSHEVVFDDRGQNINDGVRKQITESIGRFALYVRFMSKGR